METKAVECYCAGYSCSQCMLKAAEEYYGLKISEDAYEMCKVMCAGFGIGGFCNAPIAGIMLFGLMADENAAKRMRLRLLTEFRERYGDFNCAKLKCDEGGICGCRELILFTAEKIKEIIDSEIYGR